jgi:hypothetical protein
MVRKDSCEARLDMTSRLAMSGMAAQSNSIQIPVQGPEAHDLVSEAVGAGELEMIPQLQQLRSI